MNLAIKYISYSIYFWYHLESLRYSPTWDSIDSRPNPDWYDKAKIGIFLHWGVFSVPGFQSEWFWYDWKTGKNNTVNFMKNNYSPQFAYADFAPLFKAEFFNADDFADIFEASGARYVVMTSKHHEGYTMWPSKYSWNWNSMDVGPKRDLVGELSNAIKKKKSLRFGLYHSMYEWFHQLYLQDKANNFTTHLFPSLKTLPELFEIVETYEPEIIWSDGDWEAPDTYWNSTGFLAWLYNDSPVKNTVIVNDRWGSGIMCQHGGFFTCSDHYNPGVIQAHKWENCLPIDSQSWGYRRTSKLSDFETLHSLTNELASTISCGGNILINIGIRPDGRIDPIFEEILQNLGKWLKINAEAVYASEPWKYQNDTITPNIWYTSQRHTMQNGNDKINVYAFVFAWPDFNILKLGAPKSTPYSKVTMLGVEGITLAIDNHDYKGGIDISFPLLPPNKIPSHESWVLKLENFII